MKASFDFSGGVVLVTGGANGIGAALARAAARAGAVVVVADRDEVAAATLARGSHGAGSIEAHQLDVSDADAVTALVGDVIDRHGRIDGLVCAAVVQPLGPVVDLDRRQWRRTLDVNLDGVVWACQAVLPSMIARGSGSIVVFASGTADTGKADSAPYTASKGAVVSFARTLAREVASAGVRVNVLRPGRVDTPQFRDANPQMVTDGLDRPGDVVGPLLFLLSDAATMTGSMVTRELLYRAGAEV